MRISRIQKRRFTLRCDFYAPNLQFSDGVLQSTSVSLKATDIPCQIDAEVKNSDVVAGLGQSDEFFRHSMDKLRVPSVIPGTSGTRIVPREGWYLKITSGYGDADETWYSVQSNPQIFAWKLGTYQYLIKPSTKPPINILAPE